MCVEYFETKKEAMLASGDSAGQIIFWHPDRCESCLVLIDQSDVSTALDSSEPINNKPIVLPTSESRQPGRRFGVSRLRFVELQEPQLQMAAQATDFAGSSGNGGGERKKAANVYVLLLAGTDDGCLHLISPRTKKVLHTMVDVVADSIVG